MSLHHKPLVKILEQSGKDRAGEKDYPVLSITMKHGLIDQSEKFKKRVASKNTKNYRIAHKNELVVGFPIDEGVLGFQTKYPAGIVSPAYNIWKLKEPNETHIPYLEKYLRSPQARALYASKMQGAVARRRSLKKADFLRLEIPFPKINDQIRIAHLLSKVEGLIAQRKQNLQQLDDLLKSVFLEMFGDFLSQDCDSTLEDCLKIQQGFAFKSREFIDDGVPIIKIGTVNKGFFDYSTLSFIEGGYPEKLRRYEVRSGDLLISLTGTVGKDDYANTCFVPNNSMYSMYLLNQRVGKLICDFNVASPYFIDSFLKLPKVKSALIKNNRGIRQANLRNTDIYGLNLSIPPIDLQNQFATIVEKIEAIKSHYQQSLIDLENLYGSLSQKAFKGELDLSKIILPMEQKETQEDMESIDPVVIEKDTKPTITLPAPDGFDSLSSIEGRKGIIFQWLDSYLEQLDGISFSAEHFMEMAQERMLELVEDETPELGVAEYDQLKEWLFQALKICRIEQTRNQIVIDGKPAFGNQIILKEVR